jgi:hypothetical protein
VRRCARQKREDMRTEASPGGSLARFPRGNPRYVPGSTRSPTTAAPAPTNTSWQIRTRSLLPRCRVGRQTRSPIAARPHTIAQGPSFRRPACSRG